MNEIYLQRPIKGLIQIGANLGQEYESFKDIDNLLFFEPLTVGECRTNCPRAIVEPYALGDKEEEVTMYLANNNNASASILKPKEHSKYYPHITFEGQKTVRQITLDQYFKSIGDVTKYDSILIDVQGYELKALMGSQETLKHIKQIQAEISLEELYEGVNGSGALDEYLAKHGFYKKLQIDYPGGYAAEAVYVKYSDSDN